MRPACSLGQESDWGGVRASESWAWSLLPWLLVLPDSLPPQPYVLPRPQRPGWSFDRTEAARKGQWEEGALKSGGSPQGLQPQGCQLPSLERRTQPSHSGWQGRFCVKHSHGCPEWNQEAAASHSCWEGLREGEEP